jgi:hypothetical protein
MLIRTDKVLCEGDFLTKEAWPEFGTGEEKQGSYISACLDGV